MENPDMSTAPTAFWAGAGLGAAARSAEGV